MKLGITFISRILFFIYLAAVVTLCLMKPDSFPELPSSLWFGIPADKIAHFCMFFPFPVLAWFSTRGIRLRLWPSVIAIIVFAAVGSAFAYGTELMQSLTDYRTYDIADFRADIAGLAAGAAVTLAYIIVIQIIKCDKCKES